MTSIDIIKELESLINAMKYQETIDLANQWLITNKGDVTEKKGDVYHKL